MLKGFGTSSLMKDETIIEGASHCSSAIKPPYRLLINGESLGRGETDAKGRRYLKDPAASRGTVTPRG